MAGLQAQFTTYLEDEKDPVHSYLTFAVVFDMLFLARRNCGAPGSALFFDPH